MNNDSEYFPLYYVILYNDDLFKKEMKPFHIIPS